MKTLTLEYIEKHQPHKRLAKRYGITERQLQELMIMLETDFTLGVYKFSKASRKFYNLTGIYISQRQMRYLYNVIKNYSNLYEKLKRGGKIVANYRDLIYGNA